MSNFSNCLFVKWFVVDTDIFSSTFCQGTNHTVHGQNTSGQNAGGQNTNQNCRGGQNTGYFMGQEGQNTNLLKTHIISC